MKNAPPSGSVEYWSDWKMFAPWRSRKLGTAATMPGRSAQDSSRRALAGGPVGGPSGLAGEVNRLACAAGPDCSQHAPDLGFEGGHVLGRDRAGALGVAILDRLEHL